jgi:hypothetical protein
MAIRLFTLLVLLQTMGAVTVAAQDVSRALVAVGDGASGLFVGRGLVATSADALGDRLIVQVRLYPDRSVLAQVVASDPRSGLALLRVPADGTPDPLPVLRADTSAPAGQVLTVVLSTRPQSRVQGRIRRVSADRPPSYEVELPADVNVAGAALVDERGRVVAVVTRAAVGDGAAHAASAASIRALVGRPQDWLTARPATSPAPSRTQPAPSVSSTQATERDAVLRELDSRLSELAGDVTRVGNLNARYRGACVGQYLSPVGSPWSYPWLIEKAELPECQSLRAEIERQIAEARARLGAIEETARRAGILPGELRELLRRHGLEDYDLRLRWGA